MTEQPPPGEEPSGSSTADGPRPGWTGPPPGFAGPLGPLSTPAGPGAPPAAPRPAPSPPPRPRRSPLRTIAVLVLVVGLVAFGVAQVLGGDDDPPDPADAAAELAAAMDGRDPGRLCALLSEDARSTIEVESGRTCRESLRVLFAATESARTGPLEITGVDRDGDRATVGFQWALGSGTLELVLDDGSWLVASIDPLDPSGGTNVGADSTGSQQACTTEQRTIETAVAAYEAIYGEYPPDAQALVDDGLLRELPTLVDVLPGGEVLPVGACA